jgi:nucleoside-diphosphate-sugar epimerase
MKVLFIGGTGVISSACSALCLEKGIDLYLLNRGISIREIPKAAKIIKSDIRDINQVKSLLEDKYFDVVVDWIAYNPSHINNDFELFRDKTSQFIFISSASAYQKPPVRLPITEDIPLINPFWKYSHLKIECEELLLSLHKRFNFPVTIVRPSHTYDKTKVPLSGGYTTINRMLKNKKIIIHDNGKSLWTLTHHKDFAMGFIGLLGKPETIGEAYHITSDEVLTWNKIYEIFGNILGLEPEIVHIPSEFIHKYDTEWGEGLLGDKAYDTIFDNKKIKTINPEYQAKIPFATGAEEIIKWYSADESRKQVNAVLDSKMDEIIEKYQLILNK